jgi:hypothetical protein
LAAGGTTTVNITAALWSGDVTVLIHVYGPDESYPVGLDYDGLMETFNESLNLQTFRSHQAQT